MNWYWNASATEIWIVSFVIVLPIAIALFIVCYRFAEGITDLTKGDN